MKDDENVLPKDMTHELEPEIHMDEVEFVHDSEQGIEDGDEIVGDSKIKKLQERIKALEKEKTEYLDGWQRARADYANLQKSTDEDKKRLKERFAEHFVEDLIPAIDSFSMAMSNKEAWEKVDANWRTGVEYIYNQLMTGLSNHKFEAFGEKGDMFDPSLHEAVSEVETSDTRYDHRIDTVLQQGYKLGDNVLRAARVVVLKIK